MGLALGGGHDVFDFLDASENGAEGDKFRAREAGDEARESGLAAAGRAPEEHRAEIIVFDLDAERLTGAEKLFLAEEFVEGARTHAFSEGLVSRG
jgi:hypothetical protein